MDNAKEIEAYRERFNRAPLGQWSTAVGTFSSMMDQVWEFYPDGTGKYTDYGAFGGAQGETFFEWRELADRTIEFRVTQWVEVDWDETEDEVEEDKAEDIEGPMNWITIRYDFKVVQHDCGDEVAMYDVGQQESGGEYIGFWMSLAPLAYIGPTT